VCEGSGGQSGEGGGSKGGGKGQGAQAAEGEMETTTAMERALKDPEKEVGQKGVVLRKSDMVILHPPPKERYVSKGRKEATQAKTRTGTNTRKSITQKTKTPKRTKEGRKRKAPNGAG
jgi:hypothetical protein